MTAEEPRTVSVPGLFRPWFPRQHGAWAMLAVPLLLGIAASRPVAWDVPLALAAVAGYLASATGQAWVRARARDRYSVSLAAYTATLLIFGAATAAGNPPLLAGLAVLVPAGIVTLASARLGCARGLAAGLAQVASAMVLLPSTAWLGDSAPGAPIVLRAAFLAATYLVGTMLAVRSVIREQGNATFALVSVAFSICAAVVGAAVLPAPLAVVLGLLAIRAVALPVLVLRLRGGAHPLRPVRVGIAEAILAFVVVISAFAWLSGG